MTAHSREASPYSIFALTTICLGFFYASPTGKSSASC